MAESNVKSLAPVGKFPNAIGKLMIGKTFPTNGEEIINTNSELPIY